MPDPSPWSTLRSPLKRFLKKFLATRSCPCFPWSVNKKLPAQMNITKHSLGSTHLSRSYPWGLHPRNGHRLLCADGVVRSAELAQTADTFFSIPASVRINGKRVSGYASTEKDSLWTKEVYVFRHHDGQDAFLPAWPVSSHSEAAESAKDALIAKVA